LGIGKKGDKEDKLRSIFNFSLVSPLSLVFPLFLPKGGST
jgi:hypothetical protein